MYVDDDCDAVHGGGCGGGGGGGGVVVVGGRDAQLGLISKFRHNFVKMTGYTYACNSLTNFRYKAFAMTGNGNQTNFLKFACKKSVKSLR